MWAAVAQIATKLLASAGPSLEAAITSRLGATAAKATGDAAGKAAGAAAKGPRPILDPARAMPPPTPKDGLPLPQGPVVPSKAKAAAEAAAEAALTPRQKAAKVIAGNIKQQAIGSAVSMGSSLVANTVGSIVGGAVTGRGKQQPGGGYLAQLGAGPAGQRAGAMAGNAVKSIVKVADPTGIGRGTAKGVGMVANVATFGLAGKAKEFVQSIAEVSKATEAWGKELLDGQRHLTRYNGTIARSFAEGQRREIVRNIRSGRNTSASTVGLQKSYDSLKDELQPFKDAAVNTLNRLAQGLTLIVTSIVRYGKPIAETVLFMQKNWPWGSEEAAPERPRPMQEFMQNAERGQWRLPEARA